MRKKIILSLLFSLVVYASIIYFLGSSSIIQILKSLSLTYVMVALLFIILGLAFEFIKWKYYLNMVDFEIGFKHNLRVYLSSLSMAFMPGKSGEFMRYYMLKKKGLSLNKFLPIQFMSNLTTFFVIFLFCLPILFTLKKQFLVYAVLGLVLASYFFLRYSSFYLTRLKFKENKNKNEKFRIFMYIRELFKSSKCLLKPEFIFLQLFMTLMYYSCIGLAFFFVLKSFAVNGNFVMMFSIYSASLIAGALSMLPGGIGAVEGGSILLFSQFMDMSLAASIVIMMRLISLWFITLIGMAFFSQNLLTSKM